MNKNDKLNKAKLFWKEQPPQKKKIIISSSATILVLIIVLIFLYSKDSYEFLLSTDNTTVSSNVLNQLDEDKIKYNVKGNSIYVTGVDTDALKIKLSSDNILDSSDNSLELYQKPMFVSEAQEKTLMKKDLENNLSKTLKGDANLNVKNATVILSLGTESAFKESKTESKAAVKLTINSELSGKQVASIQEFIAAAVPNLAKENVVITDQNNNSLSKNNADLSIENNDGYKKALENSTTEKIKELLSTAFPDTEFGIIADIDIDFDNTKIENQTVSSGPDTIASIQKNESIQRDQASKGEPGTGSNIPTNGTQDKNKGVISEERSETINYELNKKTEQIIKSPSVKQLAVAITANKPLTPVEEDKISDLVSVIINSERGDKLSIQSFDTKTIATDESNIDINEYAKIIITKLPFAIIAIIILILILKISKVLKTKKEEPIIYSEIPETEEQSEVLETPETKIEEFKLQKSDESSFARVLGKEIEEQPQQVANALKKWLD